MNKNIEARFQVELLGASADLLLLSSLRVRVLAVMFRRGLIHETKKLVESLTPDGLWRSPYSDRF